MKQIKIGHKFIGQNEDAVMFEMVFDEDPHNPGNFGDATYLLNGKRVGIADYKLALATLNSGGNE